MVGRSLDAHNECSAPALMEETPKALRVAVVEDDPRIQQLISAEITDEGHACICFWSAEDFLDEAGSDRFDLHHPGLEPAGLQRHRHLSTHPSWGNHHPHPDAHGARRDHRSGQSSRCRR